MTTATTRLRHATSALLALAAAMLAALPLPAQRDSGPMRDAAQLDRDGRTEEARALYQSVLDTVSDPRQKAAVQRSIAMSWAFDGDCENTMKYEQMVIAYWKTQENADPQDAFYQQGEMANEGARVCVDSGDLDTAEHWYREGYRMGLMEPEPRAHPVSLWDFRLAHALGRIAARRGEAEEARRQVEAARRALDSDPEMAEQQERFFPYLAGYVALYTNDLETARAELERAVSIDRNEDDPFMNTLLAMTYERLGMDAEANELYRKAFDLARSHNPPAAYVRRVVREKLGS
jgi:tetratricopeptide (TPR) repeat protein